MEQPGLLFLLVGPSGAGRTTLLREVLASTDYLLQMPTITTRAPRANETEGQQYHFFSEERFARLVGQDAFFEHQVLHDGKCYGVLRSVVDEVLGGPIDYVAEIDPLGARKFKQHYPQNVVLVFIRPPSMEALEQRMRARGALSEHEIADRLGRAAFELSLEQECDYVVVNEDVETAADRLKEIVLAEMSRRDAAF